MKTDLVIIGTGGQGRECLDVVEAMNQDGASINVIGFVDDAPSTANKARVEELGYPIIGNIDALVASPPKAAVCIGIANSSTRRRIDQRLSAVGLLGSAPLIHPDCSVGTRTELGPGSVLWAGARLTTNVRVDSHVHINQNATIGHDTCIRDYVTINPLAAVSGAVELGQCSLVGAGAVVLQRLSVGSGATVGASACVTKDVKARDVVTGVPARPVSRQKAAHAG